MILMTHQKPSAIIKKFAKHFNCSNNAIEAKNWTSLYDERMAYIRGEKITEKLELVEADKKERITNDIPHLIEL